MPLSVPTIVPIAFISRAVSSLPCTAAAPSMRWPLPRPSRPRARRRSAAGHGAHGEQAEQQRGDRDDATPAMPRMAISDALHALASTLPPPPRPAALAHLAGPACLAAGGPACAAMALSRCPATAGHLRLAGQQLGCLVARHLADRSRPRCPWPPARRPPRAGQRGADPCFTRPARMAWSCAALSRVAAGFFSCITCASSRSRPSLTASISRRSCAHHVADGQRHVSRWCPPRRRVHCAGFSAASSTWRCLAACASELSSTVPSLLPPARSTGSQDGPCAASA